MNNKMCVSVTNSSGFTVLILGMFLLFSGIGNAQNGIPGGIGMNGPEEVAPVDRPGQGQGHGSGQGSYHGPDQGVNLSDGIPFDYAEVVVASDSEHSLEIVTGDGTITIHGIGPQIYWDSLTVERPVAGDTVSITGFSVDFNETSHAIAVTVTVDGQTIELRDSEGKPVWRGNGQAFGPHSDFNLLEGDYFEFTGLVESTATGRGMKITLLVGDEIITITGIGSLRYWDDLGITRPSVGENITVTGYTVYRDDLPLNYAATVIFDDGTTVVLLDEDGKPLWFGKNHQQ